MRCSLLLASSLAVASVSAAQVTAVSSVTFTSPYVFRGAVFSKGLTVQPALEVRRGAFAVGAFANVDPNGTASGTTFVLNEADVYAGVSHTVGRATVGAVYTLYTFPTPGADGLALAPTNEVALSARLDGRFAPSVVVAYDFDGDEADGDLKGVYAELGGALALGGRAPVTLGAALGVDAGYLLPEGTVEPAFVSFSAGTSAAVGGATLAPKVAVQVSLADAYRTTFAQPTLVYGSLTVSF